MKILPYLFFVIVYYLIRFIVLYPYAKNFYAAFLNVGQGDSFVVNMPKYGKILIDAGPNYQANYLIAKGNFLPICDIKLVFITHYDSDHSGGLERILKFCSNAKVSDDVSRSERILIDNLFIEILWPEDSKNLGRKDNEDSLVLFIDYKKYPNLANKKGEKNKRITSEKVKDAKSKHFSFLITGDSPTSVLEKLPLERYQSVLFYKVSHHGSKHNTSELIVKKLKPKYCIISVGKNRYGHPHKEVLSILQENGCFIHRTDLHGTLMVY